ncbi:MAG TPA: LysR family transcriptional regulator [Mucilaginibacter sp.]|nr:LysR family transcriptional regulator [Mucilaginibacter sp.]
MNYTLHQLQVFTKVAETQSITKAAQELFLTQPGVSIQLKNFQDQFDVALTEVIGRKLFITDFGKEIAAIANDILQRAEEINYKAHAFKGTLAGRLRIAVVSTGKYVMPYFLSSFLRENPAVDLTMDVINKAGVIQRLTDNEVDFGLVSVLPDGLNILEEKLLENKLFLVGNGNHDRSLEPYDRGAFTKLPMIYREEGSATRMIMEGFFERSKIVVEKKIELTSNEAVKQAVIAGLGYSVMPLIGIRNELKIGELTVIPAVDFPISSEWRLIWLKSKKLSPVASEYLGYLKQNKEIVIKEKFAWINDVRRFKTQLSN